MNKKKYVRIKNEIYMVSPKFRKLKNKKWIEDIDMEFRYFSPSFMNFEKIDEKEVLELLKKG